MPIKTSGWVNKNMFDNSDFPKDSPYHDAKNKNVIGKFKEEAAGVPFVEFEGLRSKMYLHFKDNGKNEKTAKGVKKYVITKHIKHKNYKDTLRDKKRMMHKMNAIRSECYQIGSYELNKISL